MDLESNNNAQKPTSVLQGDGYYFDRLLLRENSIGCSSRIDYQSCEGVPFQWETQPGTPINPPESDVVSPLTPPPAHQNMGLPRPCLDKQKEPSFKITSKRIMFWKKIKKTQSKVRENMDTTGCDRNESLGPFNSDGEIADLSRQISSLSSSSSVCSRNFPQQPKKPFIYSPQDITMSMMGEEAQHTEALFLRKILSRNSSANQSSPVYYQNPEGMPYKWEIKPGKSIIPPNTEFPIPLPRPPPALQSQDLPLPRLDRLEDSNTSKKLWYRRKPSVPLLFGSYFRSNSSCSSRSGRGLRDEAITCTHWNFGTIVGIVRRRV